MIERGTGYGTNPPFLKYSKHPSSKVGCRYEAFSQIDMKLKRLSHGRIIFKIGISLECGIALLNLRENIKPKLNYFNHCMAISESVDNVIMEIHNNSMEDLILKKGESLCFINFINPRKGIFFFLLNKKMEYDCNAKSIIYPVLPSAPSDEGHNYRLQKISEIQKEIENEKKIRMHLSEKYHRAFRIISFAETALQAGGVALGVVGIGVLSTIVAARCDCVLGCCYRFRVFIDCRRSCQQKTGTKSGEA